MESYYRNLGNRSDGTNLLRGMMFGILLSGLLWLLLADLAFAVIHHRNRIHQSRLRDGARLCLLRN